MEDSKVDQSMQYKDINNGATSYGFGPYFTMAVILVIAWVAKKRKLALTGSHNKYESLSLDSFPRQNGALKYRDTKTHHHDTTCPLPGDRFVLVARPTCSPALQV